MTHHVLACALYCNSDGSLNGAGTVVAWALGVPLVVGLVGNAIRLLFGNQGEAAVSDLLREIVMMIRSPREWWRGTYMVPCPVCREVLSIRGGMWSDWRSHRAVHGNEAWQAALGGKGGLR